MKPKIESALEMPKKEDPRRITVTSAKRTDDVVQAPSCGAGSVGRTLSKPLPYGWYSKRVCKKPFKEVHAATSKMDGSMFAVRGVDAKTVRMHEYELCASLAP